MAEAVYEYVGLSTRDGFNRSLRHFMAVNDIVPDFEAKVNLADALNGLLDEKAVKTNQIAPIVRQIAAIAVDLPADGNRGANVFGL